MATATEYARLLGVSTKTVYRRIAEGKIKAHKTAPNRYEIDAGQEIAPLSLLERLARLETQFLEQQKAIVQLQTRLNAILAFYPLDPSRRLSLTVNPTISQTQEDIHHPNESSFSHLFRGFARKSEVLRFLSSHGVNKHTAKDWSIPISIPSEVLSWVIEYLKSAGYRAASIKLHRCDNQDCPCQQMLV